MLCPALPADRFQRKPLSAGHAMPVRSIPLILCRLQRMIAAWLVLTALVLTSLVSESVCGDEPESLAEPSAETVADKPPTPQELMTARGLVRYRSMWRTVQEIEIGRAHV